MAAAVASPQPAAAPAEYQLPSPPVDPVAALAFSPKPSPGTNTRLLVASWDKLVRLLSLPPSGADAGPSKVQLLHTFQHDAAVLDVCWVNDTLAASASLDRRVRLLNLETGQINIIGKHASGVSRIRYNAETNLLVTVSWDKTLKLWDPCADPPRLLKTLSLPDKALAMDMSPPYPHAAALSAPASAQGGDGVDGDSATATSAFQPITVVDATPRAVVAMTGRAVHIYNLRKLRELCDAEQQAQSAPPQPNGETESKDGENGAAKPADASRAEAGPEWEPEQKRESSLRFMVRDVRVMPGGHGYALSSVEGRIGVEFFDASAESQAKKYAFKCHRQVVEGIDTVYPVNAMVFHPGHGTFASLGGDATLSIWDAVAKKRIRQYARYPSPLSAAAISSDGTLLAVASGAENIEDTRHPGPGAGEVGEVGRGGEGNVRIHVRVAWDDFKPKAKAPPTAAPAATQ